MKINFEAIFENFKDPILIQDGDGKLIHFNPSASQLWKLSPENAAYRAVEENGQEILDTEFLPKLLTLSTQAEQTSTVGVKDHYGVIRWFTARSNAYFDEHQRTLSYVVSTFVEKSKERYLSTEISNLWSVLDRSMIYSVTNLQGVITQVNDNFCQASGYSRENLIGQNHRILNSGTHELSFFEGLWATLLAGKPWKGTIRNQRKNGSFYWIECVISPLFSASGVIDRFISVSTDVTERKAAEEKMIESSKFIALGEMAGGIAHEINNPLTVIGGKTTLLNRLSEKGELTPDALRSSLDKINQMSVRISKIVNGLRSFARGTDQDPFETLPASKLIESSLSLCSERFKNHGIRLEVSEIPGVEVIARSGQVSQVIMNLLSNSFDAISQLPEKWVRVDLAIQTNGRLAIKVIDSGKGLNSIMAKNVMEPFFTTKPAGKGTGLGLSISKAIAEENGGDLYLDEKALNTTFVFELKISE